MHGRVKEYFHAILSSALDRARGMSNVRDTHVLTQMFSAVVTRTHAGSCWPCKEPFVTIAHVDLKHARCVGDPQDARRFSLRKVPVAWGTRWILIGLLCRGFERRLCVTTGEVDLKRPLHGGHPVWS
jgi:hypothetical protein